VAAFIIIVPGTILAIILQHWKWIRFSSETARHVRPQ
jgi:hypothetical protein